MNNPYKSEKEFLDNLESFLKECKFQTWREVVPDEHKNFAMPFRVDLIFYREDLGYMAVEGKNFRSLRQGGAFAESLKQINKYRDLHYFNGTKISRWCITSPVSIPAICSKEIETRVIFELIHFIKHFINSMFDISLLEFNEYSNKEWNRISIDALVKNRMVHINRFETKKGCEDDKGISEL